MRPSRPPATPSTSTSSRELARLGVHWVSLAPRYIGRFEKGVDYIGDLAAFEADFALHAAIARRFGPYKLSLHSGSDKFSVYPIAMAQTRGLVHLKTAGTSYLEALRTIAALDPALFREIYVFARGRYPTDRASYHVSADLAKAPAARVSGRRRPAGHPRPVRRPRDPARHLRLGADHAHRGRRLALLRPVHGLAAGQPRGLRPQPGGPFLAPPQALRGLSARINALTDTPAADKSIALGHPSYVWRFGQDRRLDLINQHAPLQGKRILDVGCGLGMYVRKFRAFSPDAFGVDIDLEKLAEGARELPNLAQSVAESLPFPDGSFDVVLLHEVIEHVRSDREAVAEAYRCLRPGGRLVIFAPNRLYPLETHGFYLGKRYIFKLAPIIPWLPDPLRRRFCPTSAPTWPRTCAGCCRDCRARPWSLPRSTPATTRSPAAARGWPGCCAPSPTSWSPRPLRAFGISHLVVYEKTAG